MANFFMEYFEGARLRTEQYKPNVSGFGTLLTRSLADHMEVKHYLHFWDITTTFTNQVYNDKEGGLYLAVNTHLSKWAEKWNRSKETYTDRNLNAKSYHHPVQKRVTIKILVRSNTSRLRAARTPTTGHLSKRTLGQRS